MVLPRLRNMVISAEGAGGRAQILATLAPDLRSVRYMATIDRVPIKGVGHSSEFQPDREDLSLDELLSFCTTSWSTIEKVLAKAGINADKTFQEIAYDIDRQKKRMGA